IVLAKKVGDVVKIGDVLAVCHTNKEDIEDILKDIENAFVYDTDPFVPAPIVHRYVK
ncbi:MAG: pyrimidine-nucleoside phosphorylase, partial [Bacilli bacterium]|nr:pyrimidine-nucleoside phosphorylase [Bacilli bacterium]